MDGSTDSLPIHGRATAKELANNPFAIVNHLSFPICYGAAEGSFKEIESIPGSCQFLWSTGYVLVRAITFNPCEHGHPSAFET
jgi:hypothetical protein